MEKETAFIRLTRLSIAVSLLLAACAQAAPTSQTRSVQVCYSALAATQVPLLYAVEKGYFESEGLQPELHYFQSGTDAATAMIAGEVDICQIAGSSVVNAAVAGEDLVILAGLFNTHVYSLLVTPDIQEPQDLVGKSVAVSRLGSSSDAAIRLALRSFGLEPDTDVAIVAIGDQSARIAALETGQIAGTVASIPGSTIAKRAGMVELLDMSTLDAPFQHTAIASTRSYLESNRDTAVAFMKAMVLAIQAMKQDREGTEEVMAKYLAIDFENDRDLLEQAYRELVPAYLPDLPYPTLGGIQALLDGLETENPAAADVRPGDLVDLTILEESLVQIQDQ